MSLKTSFDIFLFQSPREMPRKEFIRGVLNTTMLSPRLPGTSNDDSFTHEQRVNHSPEHIHVLQGVPESDGSDPSVDSSSLIADPATGKLGLMIDRGARIVFPALYAAFTIAYFVLI